MFETNVLGTVRTTRALLPALEASGDGHVVMMGSVAGIEPYPGGAGYNAAKFGVRAFTQVLRLELLGRPVRITEIDPGMVETEFSVVRFRGDAERAAKVYEGVDALSADDVADCVAFAVTRPPHVNLDQIVVTSRDQALARTIHRRPSARRYCMNGADSPPVFTGVAVALVTFFDAHGHVDLAATARHAEHLAGRGMRALVVAGTTGEASHLSMKERLQLLDAVRGAVGDDVPVILGTGNLAAGVSVPDLTRRAAEHGASGALTLSPHHGDVREFYGEVVAAAGVDAGARLPLPAGLGAGHHPRGAEGPQGGRHQGLVRRLRAPARHAGPVPQPVLHGQLVDRGLGRDARRHRRHPRRRQPRARAVRRRLRRQRRRPRRTCWRRTRS